MRDLAICVLLLLGLVGSSCGPNKHIPKVPGWPNGPAYVTTTTSNPHLVTIPWKWALDSQKQSKIMDAVTKIVQAFENQECVIVPPTVIGISEDAAFPCGTITQPIAYGCWCLEYRLPESILTICGEFTLPALYHELAHRTFYLWGHTDSRWPVFDQRGQSITFELSQRP